ncbi:hypothetical protein M9458_053896, partial [Cirrhinus mrigala]
DLVKGQSFPPDEVAELHRTTDLALRATKQATTHMGRVIGALVVMERHLWVNLADIGKKERGFLFNAPVSPSVLFGTSVETVVERFVTRSAAFKSFIPRRSRSEPEQHRGPGPSRFQEERQAQRTSAATHVPPPPVGGNRIWHGSRGAYLTEIRPRTSCTLAGPMMFLVSFDVPQKLPLLMVRNKAPSGLLPALESCAERVG